MILKKLYSFSNGRQIWRIIPTEDNKLIIEERDTEHREVFFSCLDIFTGKKIFSDLQLEEKFWVGIEAVYKNIILFHGFAKPDMPGHKGITAFDVEERKIIWKNSEHTFLFIYDDKIYCYSSLFEGRNYYSLNYKTGEMISELGNNSADINQIREKVINQGSFEDYIFPEIYNPGLQWSEKVSGILDSVKQEKVIAGRIEYAVCEDILFFNFHEVQNNSRLKNIFMAIELNSGKTVFEETLNEETQAFVPDSFFFKQNLLFLLQEKVRLVVYNLKS